jgi:hypothetical protein
MDTTLAEAVVEAAVLSAYDAPLGSEPTRSRLLDRRLGSLEPTSVTQAVSGHQVSILRHVECRL